MNDLNAGKAPKKRGMGLNSLLGQAALSTGFNTNADVFAGSQNTQTFQQPVVQKESQSSEKPQSVVTEVEAKNTALAAEETANKTQAVTAQATQPAVPPESRIWNLGIDKLNPNEYQPRQKFNKETLEELAASIKEKGILQPIVARRHINGTFEIISGERRWRAAQIAGLKTVPVILKTVTDKDALELAIIENVQREDLNAIDEAEAYHRLITEFGITQAQAAEKVGKDRSTVTNALRLLALTTEVRDMVSSGTLSAGHAKAIASVEDVTRQVKIAKQAVDKKLSVRAIEKLVAGKLEEDQEGELLTPEQKAAAALQQELQQALGTKVSIDYKLGKGKISLWFYSDEELNDITDKLREVWQK